MGSLRNGMLNKLELHEQGQVDGLNTDLVFNGVSTSDVPWLLVTFMSSDRGKTVDGLWRVSSRLGSTLKT